MAEVEAETKADCNAFNKEYFERYGFYPLPPRPITDDISDNEAAPFWEAAMLSSNGEPLYWEM
ncbi:hypothetical protein C8J56DRAFT_1055447 [Mycena floridula]|nr:hypothetical protein C8J56DRAFT_1055447 [Mycena floridula]